MKMEKKVYQAPRVEVVACGGKETLLSGSLSAGTDVSERPAAPDAGALSNRNVWEDLW